MVWHPGYLHRLTLGIVATSFPCAQNWWLDRVFSWFVFNSFWMLLAIDLVSKHEQLMFFERADAPILVCSHVVTALPKIKSPAKAELMQAYYLFEMTRSHTADH